MKKDKRISKDYYYLRIARTVRERAVCIRKAFGAVIVKNDQIIATGYTGAPRKTPDCFQRGFCLRQKLNIPSGQQYELCRSVHAEQNAIINAARAGVSLLEGDLYTFGSVTKTEEIIDAPPCMICKKMVINAGLKRVICSVHPQKTYKNLGIFDFKVYYVEDWIKFWQDHDITEDPDVYEK
jgi:dCMP deaminase